MNEDGLVPLKEAEASFVYRFDRQSYEEARGWLKEDSRRHLVFFDDQIDTPPLQDPQVRFYKAINLEEVARHYALCPIHFVPLKGEDGEDFFQSFVAAFHRVRTEANQDLNLDSTFYHNFYRNIQGMEGDFIAESLFGSFPKVAAVLCGAGASLERIVEVKDRALILAGGSALTALGTYGVTPHFGAALSPGSFEHDRLLRANLFDIPLFYSPKIAKEALDVWGGEKIAVLGDGPPVVRWFSKEFGFQGVKTQEGPSVMGMLLEIAYQMGCDPIIFLGVDLSGPYAKGVEAIESLKGLEKIWEAEAKALGEMAKVRKGPTYLNASEGRMIPNIPSVLLADIPSSPQDFDGQIKALLGKQKRVSQEKIEKAFAQLRGSFERILPILDEMGDTLKVAAKEAFKHSLDKPLIDDKLKGALEKEIAYPLILEEMALARSIYLKRVYDNFLAGAGKMKELHSQRLISIKQEKVQFLHQATLAQLAFLT